MSRRWLGRSRLLLLLLVVAGAGAGAGCPREVNVPEPVEGEPCTEMADCNAGATCGSLRACVAGHCERDASITRPCADSGGGASGAL